MSRACCSWRVALTKTEPPAPTPPPALPWLLPKVDGEHGLTFSCALSGWRRTHPFFLPHAPRCASYFGSYDGAWLFLALTDRVFSEAEQTVWLSPLEQVEDLLYLDEDFLFLTKEEHIRVCPELTIFHEYPERILWRFQPRRRRDDDEEEEQVLATSWNPEGVCS
uniref:Uncharacterized protein n=1 Tax=Oryza nivara TaxID=4536 RepID=A0A0E0IQJ8_ORYNI